MGSEDVDEQIEWEARRVMMAFGFEVTQNSVELARRGGIGSLIWYSCHTEHLILKWAAESDTGILVSLAASSLPEDKLECRLFRQDNQWTIVVHERTNAWFLACGLCRLGIEAPQVLDKLNYPLSAHEKMELRLSMPREFWPKKWLEEEPSI